MRRPHRQTLGLVVEGQRREFLYFDQVRIEFKERERRSDPVRVLTVKPASGGSAAGILVKARGHLEDEGFDRVFCVLDGDRMDEASERALSKAREAGVQVFFSLPCFEAWLLLHVQETCPAEESCEPLKKALQTAWPDYEKRPQRDWARLRGRTADAKARALRGRRTRGDGRGTTQVDELMTILGF